MTGTLFLHFGTESGFVDLSDWDDFVFQPPIKGNVYDSLRSTLIISLFFREVFSIFLLIFVMFTLGSLNDFDSNSVALDSENLVVEMVGNRFSIRSGNFCKTSIQYLDRSWEFWLRNFRYSWKWYSIFSRFHVSSIPNFFLSFWKDWSASPAFDNCRTLNYKTK